MVDNVVPYIPKEEDKVELETKKVLGNVDGDHIAPASFPLSTTCTRVGVLEGHTEVVHLTLSKPAGRDEIIQAWRSFGREFVSAGYPSAPGDLIFVHEDPFRPQVRLDRNYGDGMTTVVGRLRPDESVKNGWKFMLVSHNTKLGAAKGCILLAEYMLAEGLIG